MTASIGNSGITFSSTYIQGDVALGASSSAQSWQNVTGSRALGTTYTNSTGRPIIVAINTFGAGTTTITIGGVAVQIAYCWAGHTDGGGWAIVPVGVTYVVSGASLGNWYELR